MYKGLRRGEPPPRPQERPLAAKAARTLPAASGGRQRPARGLPGHPGGPGRGSLSQTPASDPSTAAKMAVATLQQPKTGFWKSAVSPAGEGRPGDTGGDAA